LNVIIALQGWPPVAVVQLWNVRRLPYIVAKYCLNSYSIPELLKLLQQERAERILLEVGSQPSLTIKGQDFEIEGPAIGEEAAEELIRAVADTRQMRVFRRSSSVHIVHKIAGTSFLIRVVHAVGHFSIELRPINT
jgi:Tfp pilus assembly ATPase PilU